MNKKLFLVCGLALATVILVAFSYKTNSPSETVIGTYEGTTYTITYSLDDMKSQWETALQNGGITADLSGFEIIYNAEDEQYMVIATDEGQNLKTAIPLEDAGDGNLIEQLRAGGGLTVTCSGCELACHPKIIDMEGYCSPSCSGSQTCTKTETLTIGSNFVN